MPNEQTAELAASLAQASLLHQQGKLNEAGHCYERALLVDPNHFESHYMLGLLRAQQGDFLAAVKAIGQALKINPRHQLALSNFGNVLRALGQPNEALLSYDAAISGNQDDAVIWFNRGLLLSEMGRFSDAVDSYQKVISIVPGHIEARMACATTLAKLGRLGEALDHCDAVIGLQPNLAEVFHAKGEILWRQGQYHAALDSFNTALSLAPDKPEYANSKGLALAAMQRHEDAIKCYDAALALRPKYADALNNRGNALANLQRFDQALECYEQARIADPANADALSNVGAVLSVQQRFRDALRAYDTVLQQQPRNNQARYNRGLILQHLQRFEEALAEFQAVLYNDPQHPYALSAAAGAALNLCDWPRVKQFDAKLAHAIAQGSAIIAPFTLLGYSDNTALHLACAKAWLQDKGIQYCQPWREPIERGHDKLRIAYVSSDFGAHPVGYQLAALLELHDRSAFEVHGVSLGDDDSSDIRNRLAATCDQFHDVRRLNDREIIQYLRQLEIDIALDLNGHTQYAKPSLFAAAIAPVRVGWLGYPSTTGMDGIDYIIADCDVLPFSDQAHYSEKIVHLPNSFFAPGDAPLAMSTPSRKQEGLPESGLIFCCFNQSWKIREAIFEVWMRLLKNVPGSVVWLSDHPQEVRMRLVQAARSYGIDADRLVWAQRVSREEHLSRLRLADLILDTLPYNAHATASDGIWAGVPIITCQGGSFAGRVASSILRAAGLPELITSSLTDYEALAMKLALDPDRRRGLREKIINARSSKPFFDAAGHARMMEAAYRQMWRTLKAGQAPKGFSLTVEPVCAFS